MPTLSTLTRLFTETSASPAKKWWLPFTLFLTACPGPNTYGTARTIEPGQVQTTVAIEVIADEKVEDPVVVYLPTILARVGVGKHIDLGIGLHNLVAPSVDLKLELTRGVVDMAVAPSVVITTAPPIYGAYVHLPLMLTANLGDHVAMTAVPGLSYGSFVAPNDDSGRGLLNRQATGVLGRLGLGLQVKPSKRFAFGPELTWLGPLHGKGYGEGLFFGGVGFHILAGGED